MMWMLGSGSEAHTEDEDATCCPARDFKLCRESAEQFRLGGWVKKRLPPSPTHTVLITQHKVDIV